MKNTKYVLKKDSWLYSEDFIKRAIAIWGYAFIGHLIIVFSMMLVFMILALIIGLFSLIFG